MSKEKARAKAKAWKIFSLYIRCRDQFVCFTCDRPGDRYTTDAGHMVGRYWKATLFDETNVNCQCRACNTAHESNPAPYRIAFIAKWGKHKYNELYAEREKNGASNDTGLSRYSS